MTREAGVYVAPLVEEYPRFTQEASGAAGRMHERAHCEQCGAEVWVQQANTAGRRIVCQRCHW